MSTSRLMNTKMDAVKMTPPCTTGVSLARMESIIRRPTPGQAKTVSVRIAPPKSRPI